MSRSRPSQSTRLAAWLSTWLVLGSLALLLTPLTAWTPLLGWAPLLWLVLTPAAWLWLLDPRLPLRPLAAWARRHPV